LLKNPSATAKDFKISEKRNSSANLKKTSSGTITDKQHTTKPSFGQAAELLKNISPRNEVNG
jgi:hypothetical protein